MTITATIGSVASFHGGLHLDGHKKQSTGTPIADFPLPEQLRIPVSQHVGVVGKIIVKVGDYVRLGQALTMSEKSTGDPNAIGAIVHASSSGYVTKIEPGNVVNRSGQTVVTVTISCDGRDQTVEALPAITAPAQHREQSIERLHQCGVVGLGGAAFPTDVKISIRQKIDTLIVNAVECEPYITCDDMLMREQPGQIVEGASLLAEIVDCQHVLIGIEDNKPEAIRAMRAAAEGMDKSAHSISVMVVPTIYPSGGEKQLIKLLTGNEVPSGGLPADLGIVCVNVATAAACRDALLNGMALTERVVTITGDQLENAGNYRIRIGTPIQSLLEYAKVDGISEHTVRMGGPLMGVKVKDPQCPVVKATNCILSRIEPMDAPEQSCIRCGDCVRVCPANLLPQQLYWYTRATEFEKAEEHGLFDCIECGCCDYVCPSHIPLVDYYRFAKFEVNTIKHERARSDRARERFEAREERLQRKAEEKAALRKAKLEKLKKRDAAAKKASDTDTAMIEKNSKRDEIAAAVARVKARKKRANTDE